MDALVLYNEFVFLFQSSNKLGLRGKHWLTYKEEFHGTTKEFCKHYQKEYPNATKQVFLDTRKPLRKEIREAIESSDKYKSMLRKKKLESIL
jgi:hypothetical protein